MRQKTFTVGQFSHQQTQAGLFEDTDQVLGYFYTLLDNGGTLQIHHGSIGLKDPEPLRLVVYDAKDEDTNKLCYPIMVPYLVYIHADSDTIQDIDAIINDKAEDVTLSNIEDIQGNITIKTFKTQEEKDGYMRAITDFLDTDCYTLLDLEDYKKLLLFENTFYNGNE